MKDKLYLQPHWLPVVGETVEIRRRDELVRTGEVDGVTADDQILWIAANGAEPRTMYERAQGYSVWIEYKWETLGVRPGVGRVCSSDGY